MNLQAAHSEVVIGLSAVVVAIRDGEAVVLTVRPRDRSMRRQVPWMFFDIDTRTHELRALDLELEDKSRIRTVFTKTEINPKIDPAVFTPDTAGYLMR